MGEPRGERLTPETWGGGVRLGRKERFRMSCCVDGDLVERHIIVWSIVIVPLSLVCCAVLRD